MWAPHTLSHCLALASAMAWPMIAFADDNPPAPPSRQSLVDLSQEVAALQALYALDVTRSQLEALRKIAQETAAKPRKHSDDQGSDALRKTLAQLREALVQATEDDRIDKLLERLDKLRDSEDSELDDGVDLTEDSVERAPGALRLLTPRQVATYLAGMADDIGDPLEELLGALGRVRGLAANKWKDERDGVADQVSRLLGGLDDERTSRIADQVVQLLIVARSLKEAEFKTQLPELEKKARQIVGDQGPTEVLRNVMEQVLAELLSNPRLPAAIDARLKQPTAPATKNPAPAAPSDGRTPRPVRAG
jgi:hypothetical protein